MKFLFRDRRSIISFILLITIYANTQATAEFIDMLTMRWKKFETSEDKMSVEIPASKGSEHGWYTVMIRKFSVNTDYVFQLTDEHENIPQDFIITPHLVLNATKYELRKFAVEGNIFFISTKDNTPKEAVILFKMVNTSNKARTLFVNKIEETLVSSDNKDSKSLILNGWVRINEKSSKTNTISEWIIVN